MTTLFVETGEFVAVAFVQAVSTFESRFSLSLAIPKASTVALNLVAAQSGKPTYYVG